MVKLTQIWLQITCLASWMQLFKWIGINWRLMGRECIWTLKKNEHNSGSPACHT